MKALLPYSPLLIALFLGVISAALTRHNRRAFDQRTTVRHLIIAASVPLVLGGGLGVLVALLSKIAIVGIAAALFIGVVLIAEQARVATFAGDALALSGDDEQRKVAARKRIDGVVAQSRVSARTPAGWSDAYRWSAMASRAYVDAGELERAEEILDSFPPDKLPLNSRVGRAELLATLRAFRGDARLARATLKDVPESAPWVRRMIEIAARVAEKDGKGALKLLEEQGTNYPAGQRRTFALLRVSALAVAGKHANAKEELAKVKAEFGPAALVRMKRLGLPGSDLL